MRKVSKIKEGTAIDTLGKRIEFLRTNMNMTQAELAERIHIQRELINKIENNSRTPRIEALSDIATQLNTTTDYLLGRIDTPSIDINNIAIMEKLGLDEKAIRNLTEAKFKISSAKFDPKIYRFIVNEFIGSPEFPKLIYCIAQYIKFKSETDIDDPINDLSFFTANNQFQELIKNIPDDHRRV